MASQQIRFSWSEDKFDKLKEILCKKILVLEDQLTELNKYAFVAIVTTFDGNKILRVLFHSLHL